MTWGNQVTAEFVRVEKTRSGYRYTLKYRNRLYYDFEEKELFYLEKGDKVICDRGYSNTTLQLKIRRLA